jgi:hypothetical protein
MMSRKKMLAVVLAACAAIGIVTAATASADRHGGEHGGFPGHFGSITGYPNQINEFNLNGYEIVTSYPLGADAGNTFQQDYTSTGVTAFAIAGPNVGGPNYVRTYIALPVGHHELFVTWFLPVGTITDGVTPDVFLMNFNTGIVSDVAPPGAQPVSIGTVKIIKYGPEPLP